jgi:ribosome-binding factor A
MEDQSTRQSKVSRQLQRDLSEILREKTNTLFEGAMVTVTTVRISPDLSVAKIYISIFPSSKKEQVYNTIMETSRSIRGELGHRVSKQLRIVPELVFLIDDSLDYVDKIDELLRK